jgi:hypothetical protein
MRLSPDPPRTPEGRLKFPVESGSNSQQIRNHVKSKEKLPWKRVSVPDNRNSQPTPSKEQKP